jgi:hypothetical protein
MNRLHQAIPFRRSLKLDKLPLAAAPRPLGFLAPSFHFSALIAVRFMAHPIAWLC